MQVTARGFGPLLQFAYTAKLLLSRENIREVIRCAEFLRMHNLEDSCFSFLQAQLLSSEDGLFVRRKDAARPRPHGDAGDSAGEGEDEEEETMDSGAASVARPGDQMLPDPASFEASCIPVAEKAEVLLPEPDVPADAKESSAKHALTQYPRYKKYQLACAKNVYNASSHSTSGFASTFSEDHSGTSLQPGPAVGQIKSEPPGEENEEESITLCLSGDEPDVKGRAGDVEMERKQPSPAPAPPAPPAGAAGLERARGAPSPSCLRSLFSVTKRAEAPGLPGPSQQHFARSAACPFDKGITQGDLKTEYAPFPGSYGPPHVGQRDAASFAAGSPLKGPGLEALCKQEGELDRRSVIFSSGACDQASPAAQPYSGVGALDRELSEPAPKGLWLGAGQPLPSPQAHPHGGPADHLPGRLRPNTSCPVPIKVCPRSPPLEARTRTSSSCSSYSYAEDGSGGSPCSLPLCEFSSSPCSQGARFLAAEHPEPGLMGDGLYSQVRPQIKCEQSYGTNSSDESGSFSEADSESCPVQDRGQEVGNPHKFKHVLHPQSFTWTLPAPTTARSLLFAKIKALQLRDRLPHPPPVAQQCRRLPALQEAWVRTLRGEDPPWRRKWQPTPVSLPGEIPWTGPNPWCHKESDTTERLNHPPPQHTHTHKGRMLPGDSELTRKHSKFDRDFSSQKAEAKSLVGKKSDA